MKKTFIVANWKSNKTRLETNSWLQEFPISNFPARLRLRANSLAGGQFPILEKEIIICPPFTLLSDLKLYLSNHKSSIKVGAQDISPFEEGAYTGAINGSQIKEFADYVIIGHSERRKNFFENDKALFKKVELANKYGLAPIFCVQGTETQIPSGVTMIAYEPIDAIGTGHPDTPENAEKVTAFFKKKYNVQCVLYGGSVTPGNVKEFTQMPNVDGVLIGGASLDAKEFYAIVQNA